MDNSLQRWKRDCTCDGVGRAEGHGDMFQKDGSIREDLQDGSMVCRLLVWQRRMLQIGWAKGRWSTVVTLKGSSWQKKSYLSIIFVGVATSVLMRIKSVFLKESLPVLVSASFIDLKALRTHRLQTNFTLESKSLMFHYILIKVIKIQSCFDEGWTSSMT